MVLYGMELEWPSIEEEAVENSCETRASFPRREESAFHPNFLNDISQVLIKDYTLREGPDPDSPLEYDGPGIIGSKGCRIDWKEGMDMNKTRMKVEASKDEEEIVDSFFTFFNFLAMKEDEFCGDNKRMTLAVDFEVGFALEKTKMTVRTIRILRKRTLKLVATVISFVQCLGLDLDASGDCKVE